MKTLRKSDIESMKQELTVLVNPEKYFGGAKGDHDDPYSQNEFFAMLESGTWAGGYVEGWGYGTAIVEVIGSGTASGSSGNGSNSNTPSTPCTCGACSNFDAMNNPHNANGADKSNNSVWNPIGELLWKMFLLKHDPCCAWSWK